MPPSVEMMSASVAYRCVDLVLSSTFDVSLVVLAESDVPRYVKKLRATPYPRRRAPPPPGARKKARAEGRESKT